RDHGLRARDRWARRRLTMAVHELDRVADADAERERDREHVRGVDRLAPHREEADADRLATDQGEERDRREGERAEVDEEVDRDRDERDLARRLVAFLHALAGLVDLDRDARE